MDKTEELISEVILYVVDNYDDEWALAVQEIFQKYLETHKDIVSKEKE